MKQWTNRDKTAWPRGPWDNEPDKMQWQDPDTGLVCLINRARLGHLCGYVGVPEGHPYFAKNHLEVEEVDVHGGLTFSNFCDEDALEGHGICHKAEPGQPERVWWLGFDCAHFGDLSSIRTSCGGGEYRDVEYVKRECKHLARQLHDLPSGSVVGKETAGGTDVEIPRAEA